jgi:hypothetical protein
MFMYCFGDTAQIDKRFVSVEFIVVIAQFRVTITTNSRALTCCMNVSYVRRSRKSEQSFVSVHHIYSLCTDNILMWVCEV